MNIVIRILGIVFALMGIVYLLRPEAMKWLIKFFKQGNRIYFAGLIRFALAVVFLVGARECKYFWVILVFGILFIIGGLLIFILGPQKLKTILDWYEKQSTVLLRVIAIIVVAAGAVIIVSA